MFNNINIVEILLRLPVVILAFTVHEFAHGLAAYMLGDSTAKHDGRISLNPIHHIDPVGLICLVFFRFGWAKPVNVDPSRFKDPKMDMALTSFAGPFSNFVFAFIAMLIYYPLLWHFYYEAGFQPFLNFLKECIVLNFSLGLFNMIPIPPLDGSKIFSAVLPDTLYFRFIDGGRIGYIILLTLIWSGGFSYIIGPILQFIIDKSFILVAKIYFFL